MSICASSGSMKRGGNTTAEASAVAMAMASLLRGSAKSIKEFEWTEAERPGVAYDQFDFNTEIPVIDLGGGRCNRESVAREMSRACREWGFFQVVNHGIEPELLRRMDEQARKFFKLCHSDKLRVLRSSLSPLALSGARQPLGYTCGGAGTCLTNDFPWMEALQLPTNLEQLEALILKIWGDGNEEFRHATRDFNDALRDLSMELLEILSKELGLDENYISQHLDNGSSSVFRFNFYPPCPKPSMMMGLGAHSDPHILTILHQDHIGGLQVLKDSKWIGVRPRANSLIINVGDALQVWSNGIYKSIEHRVVCNNMHGRLSMAFFLNPGEDTQITPAPKLFNSDYEHCSKYKSFTWKEYRQSMYAYRLKGKSNLQRFTLH